MKCPKCSYTSFDYLKECKKCGELLEESRQSLNLKVREPTLFTDLYIDEPVKTTLSQVEPSFTGSSEPVNEPADGSFILENKFTAPDKTEVKTTPTAKSVSEDFSGLGNLGKMDEVEPRPATDDTFSHTSISELGKPKADTSEALEFTSSFENKAAPAETATDAIKFDGLEIENLDLFTELSDTSEAAAPDQSKDDFAFEFNMNDAENDNLKVSDKLADDGPIELELDMDDDKSLDDLLADLDKKS